MKFPRPKKQSSPQITREYLRAHIGLAGIHISKNLLNDIIHRAREHPYDEEGGVLIGHIDEDRWDYHSHFQKSLPVMHVYDFIPSGPRTQRTSVSLFSDLEFQEYEFERLTDIDPWVKHLGSWHSHHCNGIDRLSQGDLRSYFNILESPYHVHDYYVAILLYRLPLEPLRRFSDVFQHFRFYLLSRQKGRNCFELDASCIEIVDVPSPYDDFINPGYILPDALLRREMQRNSWYTQSHAKEIIKEDTEVLNRYMREFPFLSQDLPITVKGIQGFRLVRNYHLGSLLLEYSYPEISDDEGICIRIGYPSTTHTESSTVLEVRSRPLEVRHHILSAILECFTPKKKRLFYQTSLAPQEITANEKLPSGGRT